MKRIKRIFPMVDAKAVKQIAKVYQQAFGGEPWNEGFRCPVCGEIVSLANRVSVCPECVKNTNLIAMIEYWPVSKVISDFYAEMAKSKSFCFAAEEKEIFGFIWGYELNSNPQTSLYLEAPGLEKLISGNFLYIDEAAVKPEFQGQGAGFELLKEVFSKYPYQVFLLRTLNNSAMNKLVKQFGGETILEISQGRVIMKIISPDWVIGCDH